MLINFNGKIDSSGNIHGYYATDNNNTSRLGQYNYGTIVYCL